MMNADQIQEKSRGFESLRQFARKQRRQVEQCEMCSAELRPEHAHLIEVAERRLHCACDACAMLFSGSIHGKYKRVSRDVRLLADFQLTDAEWDGLLIPINLAFFFMNSLTSRVSAFYPSPAGATESLLPLEAWNSIVEANPVLHQMEPDIEALLVNRVARANEATSAQCYIVPIDACYKLVGLIRMHWHGLSGGTEVWQQIAQFFQTLRTRAEIVTQRTHA